MAEHAKDFAPSAAHRRMACPGSVVMEADEPDNETEYARRGTIAHALAAHCLEKNLHPKDFLFFKFEEKDEIIDMDMRDGLQEHIEKVRELVNGGNLLIEQGLDLEPHTGEKDAKGTADIVILSKDGKTLRVIDLKMGYRQVSAQNNAQIKTYGLAAYDQFSALGDVKEIIVGISQPPLGYYDEEKLTVAQLLAFGGEIKETMKQITAAKKSNSVAGFLHPGKKQCEYCKGAYKCPALATQVVEITGADFEDETQTELVAPVDLAIAGGKIEMLEAWIKSVRSKIETTILSGGRIKGWKLVEGKKGNRTWIDEEDARYELKKLGMKVEELEEISLLSPAKVEKKLKGNERALAKLPALYSQKAGQPSVTDIADPRPEYHANPEKDFENVAD